MQSLIEMCNKMLPTLASGKMTSRSWNLPNYVHDMAAVKKKVENFIKKGFKFSRISLLVHTVRINFYLLAIRRNCWSFCVIRHLPSVLDLHNIWQEYDAAYLHSEKMVYESWLMIYVIFHISAFGFRLVNVNSLLVMYHWQ